MSYTYLIGWSKLNKFYYGVRFAKNCNPKELWITYKTSSKHVKQFTKINGEPDIIQIRKTFNCKESAILWENKVLIKMDVIHDDRWLNRTNNKAIRSGFTRKGLIPWNKGVKVPRSQAAIEKQRQTMLGVKRGPYSVNLSEETLNQKRLNMLGNQINKGRKQSSQEKLIRSKSGMGILWWTNGVLEIKSKICPPQYRRGRLKKHQHTPLLD